MWQRESELMRKQQYLSAMVGFVGKHIAQHLDANRKGRSPTVSTKHVDAATAVESFGEHFGAACRAQGQTGSGLLWRAVRALEQRWNLQVRSGKPDPLIDPA